MRNSIAILAKMFVAAVVLAQVGSADAAELRVLCAAGMQPVMQDLGPRFERAQDISLQSRLRPAARRSSAFRAVKPMTS